MIGWRTKLLAKHYISKLSLTPSFLNQDLTEKMYNISINQYAVVKLVPKSEAKSFINHPRPRAIDTLICPSKVFTRPEDSPAKSWQLDLYAKLYVYTAGWKFRAYKRFITAAHRYPYHYTSFSVKLG